MKSVLLLIHGREYDSFEIISLLSRVMLVLERSTLNFDGEQKHRSQFLYTTPKCPIDRTFKIKIVFEVPMRYLNSHKQISAYDPRLFTNQGVWEHLGCYIKTYEWELTLTLGVASHGGSLAFLMSSVTAYSGAEP